MSFGSYYIKIRNSVWSISRSYFIDQPQQGTMFKFVCLLAVVAVAAAKPSVVSPIAYSGVPVVSSLAYNGLPAVSSVSQYSNSVLHGAHVVPSLYNAAYSPVVPAYSSILPSVALAQAPNSPAVVLDAVNGVPLNTPEVVAARVAHYQAKALSGVHHLAKRSVAPVAYTSVVNPISPLSPLVRNVVSPVVYPSQYVSAVSGLEPAYGYGYSSVVPKVYSVNAW